MSDFDRRALHGRNLTKNQRNALRELRRLLEMSPDAFGVGFITETTIRTAAEADAFIRQQTEIWRNTWILPVLDKLTQENH